MGEEYSTRHKAKCQQQRWQVQQTKNHQCIKRKKLCGEGWWGRYQPWSSPELGMQGMGWGIPANVRSQGQAGNGGRGKRGRLPCRVAMSKVVGRDALQGQTQMSAQ